MLPHPVWGSAFAASCLDLWLFWSNLSRAKEEPVGT